MKTHHQMANSSELHTFLKDFFGYDTFKGDQENIISSLMAGDDVFVLMPTGGGKSLCYQLPALMLEGTAIVVSPLIALMKNQVDAIRGFVSGNEGVAHFLNSSLCKAELTAVTNDLRAGVTKILYVAPESLGRDENVALLRELKISFYAIDEAHCISEWGHDFRPEYGRIREVVERIGRAPIIALTATATPKVQSDILKNLRIPQARIFKSSFNRPNLYYEVRDKSEPEKNIIRFIKQNPGKSGIIYCLSRKRVETLAELLNINGIRALPYHAGLDAKVRSENQDKFLSEEVEVIVATIAFGMGIDKPDVRFVIHYDIPKSIEGYYQETGRAGRDGKEGICIAFYSYKDVRKLEKFMLSKEPKEQEIGRQLLMETVAYAETSQCRRKVLLDYFGEKYEEGNCGCCDNCLHPKAHFDGHNEMILVLKLVKSLPERFKTEHLAGILSGEASAKIRSYKHDEHPLFGAGEGRDEKAWESIIRQGVIARLLCKDIENYGLISLSPEGEAFIVNPHYLPLIEIRTFSEGSDEDEDIDDMTGIGAGGGGADEELLGILKGLRKDVARRSRLQPWVIFSDPALDYMSTMYPMTEKELEGCPGVGSGKAQKYGKEFIETISKYVQDNEIVRPIDISVKMNKPGNDFQKLVNCVDKRLDLRTMTTYIGLDSEEDAVSLMEKMAEAGSKVNLKYMIRSRIDEEVAEEIFDYFRNEAQSDSLDEAVTALQDEFDELDIRIVRIQFLTEFVNGYRC